ncbi:MAG: hypothetical protein STSR0003_28060 [Smithella sp.]|jgi:hypothetical protein
MRILKMKHLHRCSWLPRHNNIWYLLLVNPSPSSTKIDCLPAQHFGFTHEELDFIINYGIKYRMGRALDNGEEADE